MPHDPRCGRVASLALAVFLVSTLAALAEPATISITSDPGCGVDGAVLGQAAGVDFSEYEVAIYIFVGEGWWTKPTFAQPTLPLAPDGTWGGDIFSHPNDLAADRIRAFLIPIGFDPPQADGDPMLPAELFAHPHAEVLRSCAGVFVSFSDALWRVKDSGIQKWGPGPNYFSDHTDNVWIDESGHLHLKITNRDGQWQAAEVVHASPDPGELGYGTYVFQIRGPIDAMDSFIVLGLFTWDTFAPEFNYREIDVEIARWGNPSDPTNAQYVVQPYYIPGNLRRFTIEATGEVTATLTFKWLVGGIEFRSWYGDSSLPPTPETLIDEWSYNGGSTPPEGDENARINLWLMGGSPPSDGQEYEITIERFEFVPLPANVVGQVPGLTIGKSTTTPGELELSWSASCGGAATDYAVHEGVLGSWDSHQPELCTTTGELSQTITPGVGGRYYLIVPLSDTAEGGYGADSWGQPRPRSSSPCRLLQDTDACQ